MEEIGDFQTLDMQARSAAQQPLPGGAVGPPVQGVVQVDAYCGLPEGLPALTQLLADALKGVLPGCPRPLQVSRPFSHPPASHLVSNTSLGRPSISCFTWTAQWKCLSAFWH